MTERLRGAGCVYAEDEAAAILARFTDPRARADAVDRRCAGTPLEHVLGRADFAGVTVLLDPPVFVPRRRAEALVDLAGLAGLAAVGAGRLVALDLGCGSGAIAAALADRHPGWEVHAADVDPAAVACARVNGERFGFAVHQGGWFDALPRRLLGRLDLVVAHLPYVPTSDLPLLPRDFREAEPSLAVDGGADGLDPWREVTDACARWLAPGATMLTQVTHAQSRTAATIAQRTGLGVAIVDSGDAVGIVAVAAGGPAARPP